MVKGVLPPVTTGDGRRADRSRHRLADQRRILQWCQVDQPHAVVPACGGQDAGLHRQPGLADAAGPQQREHPSGRGG